MLHKIKYIKICVSFCAQYSYKEKDLGLPKRLVAYPPVQNVWQPARPGQPFSTLKKWAEFKSNSQIFQLPVGNRSTRATPRKPGLAQWAGTGCTSLRYSRIFFGFRKKKKKAAEDRSAYGPDR